MELFRTSGESKENIPPEPVSLNMSRVMLSLFVFLLFSCTSRWEHADEFVNRLRCGMTMQDVEREARRYPGCTSYRVAGPNLPEFVVKHGGTRVQCFFDVNRLRAVRVMWISEPMKVTAEPQR